MDCPVTARPTVIVISDSLGDTACEVVQVSTVNPPPPHHYGVAGMHNFSSNLKGTKYKWVQP